MQPWHNAKLSNYRLRLVDAINYLNSGLTQPFYHYSWVKFRNHAQWPYVMNHFLSVGCGFCRMVLWYGSIPWVPTQPCSRSCSWSWQGNVCMPVGFLSLTWRRTSTSSVSDWKYNSNLVSGFFNRICTFHIVLLLHLKFSKNHIERNMHFQPCDFIYLVVNRMLLLRHRLRWRGCIDWSWQGVCSNENSFRKGECEHLLKCLTHSKVGILP